MAQLVEGFYCAPAADWYLLVSLFSGCSTARSVPRLVEVLFQGTSASCRVHFIFNYRFRQKLISKQMPSRYLHSTIVHIVKYSTYRNIGIISSLEHFASLFHSRGFSTSTGNRIVQQSLNHSLN